MHSRRKWQVLLIGLALFCTNACNAASTPAPTASIRPTQTPVPATSRPLVKSTTAPQPTRTPVPTVTPYPDCQSSRWHKVWSDEFNYTGLPDSQKWAYEVGYIRNQELQYYTENRYENARVLDGQLIIEAHKESYEGYAYTSASIHMKEMQVLYGRVEVRAKLPAGRGLWPAIWLLGSNKEEVGWPASGEIDIMENVGYDPDRIHMSVHTPAYNHRTSSAKTISLTVTNPAEVYHVYAIEWFKDRIDFYVDDKQVFTFENDGRGSDTWPFDKPQYLILNTAIGGTWGGRYDVDDTIFPQRFYIDYVRVFQTCP